MSALKQSYGNGFWEVGPEFGFLPKSAPLARLPAAASARSARTLASISRLLCRLPPHYADLQTLMDDLPIWKNLDCGEHGILAHEVMGAGSSSCCPRALNAFCCRAPSWTASPPCPIFLKEYARLPPPVSPFIFPRLRPSTTCSCKPLCFAHSPSPHPLTCSNPATTSKSAVERESHLPERLHLASRDA